MTSERITNTALTKHLREIMASIHTSDLNEDGEMVFTTKVERLAEIVADRALGWSEEVEVKKKNGQGEMMTKHHPPEKWAIIMVYERMEGKTPTAVADDNKGLTVTDKVSELAVKAINNLTEEETKDGDSETL